MKERIKTVVLAMLIAASLIQSYFLIYRIPGSYSIVTSESNYIKTENMGQEQRIENLIFPDHMVIHMGEDRHTLFYPESTFYQLIYSRLQGRNFGDFQRQSISSGNWNELKKDNPGIELSFEGGVPVTLLQRVMQLGSDPLFEAETISKLWIYTDKDDKVHALFFSSRGDVVYEAADVDLTVQDVQQHVDFGTGWTPYKLTSEGYYIPQESLEMIQVEVPTAQYTVEQMQRSLFFDPSMTRNIQEKDGSEIYTDSKRSLQVKFNQRWISYNDPAAVQTSEVDRTKDTLAGVDFVNQHGGFNGTYRLNIGSDEESTQVNLLPYYESYPVLNLPEYGFEHMHLEVQKELVSTYERSLLYLEEGEELTKEMVNLPYGDELSDLIKAAVGDERVVRLNPAYQPVVSENGMNLFPVWEVTLSSGQVRVIQSS
ncbi:two-component system activity regulator YycH [Neobacillus mesonae]|nr:two-component system activity regulator YycH [Neobacillus mesonae]